MEINEFSRINRKRCKEGFKHKLTDWSLNDWMTALTGEVGEAANLIKKLNRIRDEVPGNKEVETGEYLFDQLKKELADIYIYLDLFIQATGV